MEEAEKLKNESGIIAELCSEVRLDLVKKRKIEYFVAQRKEIERETKRLKRLVRSKDIRECLQEQEIENEEYGEIGEAVKWDFLIENVCFGEGEE